VIHLDTSNNSYKKKGREWKQRGPHMSQPSTPDPASSLQCRLLLERFHREPHDTDIRIGSLVECDRVQYDSRLNAHISMPSADAAPECQFQRNITHQVCGCHVIFQQRKTSRTHAHTHAHTLAHTHTHTRARAYPPGSISAIVAALASHAFQTTASGKFSVAICHLSHHHKPIERHAHPLR
jgi:hypothetical protein